MPVHVERIGTSELVLDDHLRSELLHDWSVADELQCIAESLFHMEQNRAPCRRQAIPARREEGPRRLGLGFPLLFVFWPALGAKLPCVSQARARLECASGLSGLIRQNAVAVFNRLVEPAQIGVDQTEVNERVMMTGLEPHGFQICGNRSFQVTHLCKHVAKIEVDLGHVRPIAERRAIGFRRFRQAA